MALDVKGSENEVPSNSANPVVLFLLSIRKHVVRRVRSHDLQAMSTKISRDALLLLLMCYIVGRFNSLTL